MSINDLAVQHEIQNAVDVCQENFLTYEEASLDFLREWLKQGLKACHNNQSALAEREGIHRNTIKRMMERAGVSPESNGTKHRG